MRRISTEPLKEKKTQASYAIFIFFFGSFAIKVIAGSLFGSNALLISGLFELFGVFLAVVALLRIHVASDASRNVKSDFSQEKMEFLVMGGISLLIAVSSGMLLFEVGHLIFFHTVNPPTFLAAWVAALLAGANWFAIRHLKDRLSVLEEADEKRLSFLFDKAFILSVSVMAVVLISMTGFPIMDALFSILEAVFIMGYSVFFLLQAFKGLMDASVDQATMAHILQRIKRSDPSLRVKSLKVNLTGRRLLIMTTIGFSREAPLKEAKTLMGKIDDSLKSSLSMPYEVHIGFSGN